MRRSQVEWRARSLSRSKPARPYICRLISFNRWICRCSMGAGARRQQHCDLVQVGARTMPAASAWPRQAIVATPRHRGCESSRKSLWPYGQALPSPKNFYRVPLESDVFEDRLSASARRHARGIEAVFSSRVVSFRMFANVRSGGAASAIRSIHFLGSPAT
jgi:hypothetical protein